VSFEVFVGEQACWHGSNNLRRVLCRCSRNYCFWMVWAQTK